MPFFPKKVKYRKWQKGRKNIKTVSPDTRGTTLAFGAFGLKAKSAGRIRSNQIEAARKAIARLTTKGGKMWMRIFPDRPYTAKPPEVGMGKGKGDPQGYEAEIRPGRIIFEIDGLPEAVAKEALKKAGAKLPIKTQVVARQ